MRVITVICGPLLLGNSAFVSKDGTKEEIKKSGLLNMHSPSQYFSTSNLGVRCIEPRFDCQDRHITNDDMNVRKKGL